MELTDQDTTTVDAALELAWRRSHRRDRANLLRTKRAQFGALIGDVEPDAALTRQQVINRIVKLTFNKDKIDATTLPRLEREASYNEDLGASPLPGINGTGSYDTDYYSHCGLADYHSEQREQARQWGKLVRAMIALVQSEVSLDA